MSENKKMIVRIAAAALGLGAAVLTTGLLSLPIFVQIIFYLLIYALIGWDIVLEAVQGIGRGQLFDENFLMVLATVGAFATGQYPEAVSVMLLFQIGELFQRYAVGKSRGSISQLMELCPDTACVLRDGTELEVAPEDVAVGETIIVRPGGRVPVDGTVLRGESALDTSALTGESVPGYCVPGDSLLSGVIVTDGTLHLRVEKLYADSTVAKILEMVENVSGKKSRAERFITRFSRWYTPVVVILALVLAFVPPLLDGQWAAWIQRAMNFLVVSCPCALVISVPMSFFCGIGAASREGVLIKGSSYLEQLSKTNRFVFDKTGTLTRGAFEVTQVIPASRRDEILAAAAIAEQGSDHPIARAVVRAAGPASGADWEVREIAGRGVRAQRNSEVILAGNLRLMDENGIAAEPVGAAGSVVYISKDGSYLGAVIVEDGLKPEAAAALQDLRKQGAATVMLTGDRESAAAAVAAQVGVDRYVSQLLPGDKVRIVEELLSGQEKGGTLAFVGDGINDAPVLMRADVGIAMGGIGSDAAIEAADIVLMHDRLSALPVAKKIAGKAMAIARQNIVFALGVKLLVLALTPFGLVSIWLAIFADVGVAILAILNAMRASRI